MIRHLFQNYWVPSLYVKGMWQQNPFTYCEPIVESIFFRPIVKLSAYQFYYLRQEQRAKKRE